MMVFLLHGRGWVPGPSLTAGPFLIFTTFPAWAGVWILLFLSSYLLGMNFLSGKYVLVEDGRFSFRGLWRFYRSRFLRVAPLYYFYCFMFELLSGSRFLLNGGWITVKILTFTFNGNGGIDGIGHLWYLSTAMQIYLLAPFAFLLVRRFRSPGACLTAFFACLLLGLGARYSLYTAGADWYTWIYTFSLANLDFVLCGLLLARISQMLYTARAGGVFTKIFSSLAAFFLIGYNCYIYYYGGSVNFFLYQIVLPSIYILCCSLLIIAWLPRRDSVPVYGGIWGCVNGFAKYSYAFYILHISVLLYVADLITKLSLVSGHAVVNYFVYFGISFALTLGLAVMMTNVGRGRRTRGRGGSIS